MLDMSFCFHIFSHMQWEHVHQSHNLFLLAHLILKYYVADVGCRKINKLHAGLITANPLKSNLRRHIAARLHLIWFWFMAATDSRCVWFYWKPSPEKVSVKHWVSHKGQKKEIYWKGVSIILNNYSQTALIPKFWLGKGWTELCFVSPVSLLKGGLRQADVIISKSVVFSINTEEEEAADIYPAPLGLKKTLKSKVEINYAYAY